MEIVNIHKAKTHLSRLLTIVENGEEVVIAKAGKPVAKLTPYHPDSFHRKPGKLKGKIKVAPDFDKTSKKIIDSFYNSTL